MNERQSSTETTKTEMRTFWSKQWRIPVPDDWPSSVELLKGYLWGFQEHFQIAANSLLEQSLDLVGLKTETRVIVFGLDEANDGYKVGLMEHDKDLLEANWSALGPATAMGFWNSDELNSLQTDPRIDELQRTARLNRHRGEAIRGILQDVPSLVSFRLSVGMPARAHELPVYVVIAVPWSAYNQAPRLQTKMRDRFRVTQSLIDGVIDEIHALAWRACFIPDAGDGFGVLGASPNEIARRAAARLVSSVLLCSGYHINSGSDDIISAISALPYEGRAGSGRILLADANNQHVDRLAILTEAVPLRSIRAMRKLLEAAGPAGDVLVNDGDAVGFGVLSSDYPEWDESAFHIEMLARGRWSLIAGSCPLIEVVDGRPVLPGSPFARDTFADLSERLLGTSEVSDLERIIELACNHPHGTMLIFSSNAELESRRLSAQAWRIEPRKLSSALLRQFMDIDGALLFDPTGRCHAIAVILDGEAADKGDRSRGSRFNNAIRYQDSSVPESVVIVVSTDGTIDVLPNIPARVSRRYVAETVRAFADDVAAGLTDENWAALNRQREIVLAHRFYLSQDQCDIANRALQDLHSAQLGAGGFALVSPTLRPNPEMNASYFLAENR